jgi:pyruvate dehydrogenase E2 component (dihydrolipoamide acetyltransferase)
MAEVVRMPKMSDTMTEGVIAKWHKKVGDKIKTGDLVADIETDKATMEFESYQEGVLLYTGIEEGKAAPVDAIIAILGKEGEDYKSLLEQKTADTAAAAPAPAAPKATEPVQEKTEKAAEAPAKAPVVDKPVQAVSQSPLQSSTADDGRLKASPLAKKLAMDKGIDIGRVQGSGENGRIVKRDIDWYKPGQAVGGGSSAPSFVGKESFEEVPVSQMRKAIAKRVAESKFSAPHFYVTMEIDMDRAIDARESINAVLPVKISFNDLVLKATAAALQHHPKINSSWLGDKIRFNKHINIGVAMAVDEGLLIPVIRFADGKTLSQIAAEVKTFSQKAKDKKLQPADWEGSTFTISNLGMFGIDSFTAIVNPPDSCILAVGGIKQIPVVKNNQIVPGNVMKVTLSCDHRAVDGASGAAFLKTLKQMLENPVLMLGQGSI